MLPMTKGFSRVEQVYLSPKVITQDPGAARKTENKCILLGRFCPNNIMCHK